MKIMWLTLLCTMALSLTTVGCGDDTVESDSDTDTDTDTDSDTDTDTDTDPGPGDWLSGASGEYARDGTFGKWRGTPVEIGGTWCDSDAESQVECASVKWDWAEYDGPLDVGIGAIYKDEGETWAKAAKGEYDERWSEMLNNLKSYRKGKGTTYIRLAHEFNGDWWPGEWQIEPEEVEDFVAGWRHFYWLQQKIYSEARLVWCPNDVTTVDGLDVRDAWPGSEYVDVVGVDSYNWGPHVTNQEEFDDEIVQYDHNGQPMGLETWRLFAEEKGLPLALSEWGSPAYDDGSGGSGSGDSPGFYEAYYGWLQENGGSGPGNILYEILFNKRQFMVFPETDQPNSADKYKELW